MSHGWGGAGRGSMWETVDDGPAQIRKTGNGWWQVRGIAPNGEVVIAASYRSDSDKAYAHARDMNPTWRKLVDGKPT